MKQFRHTDFRVLCWFSSRTLSGFTTSSVIDMENMRWTSLRLSISAATPRHPSAKLPGISLEALFNFIAIFDRDFEYICSDSDLKGLSICK